MNKYVAFLRGINLGGRTVKMEALRKVFAAQGFTDVKTLLASGNVIFAAKETDTEKLRTKIEKAVKQEFGFDVHIILRSEKEIQNLVKAEPFKGVKATPKTRFYITFLSSLPAKTKSPKRGAQGIRAITKSHIVSVLGEQDNTPDHMDTLVKQFGANITTRSWNTVMKIHKLMEGE